MDTRTREQKIRDYANHLALTVRRHSGVLVLFERYGKLIKRYDKP